MHPGPMNRGLEIASDIADSERSLILSQATNGIAVRMAIMASLLEHKVCKKSGQHEVKIKCKRACD